ncbi:hypothetical protein [Halomicrobium salinisoli]|uniref:hypothetical protein n=1 Tax=Halomicrobium salinisoli TaxID=2878391 RepID=UPI001CEFF95C|nr:hypothetical protein [Halomicrobium salinisoli]
MDLDVAFERVGTASENEDSAEIAFDSGAVLVEGVLSDQGGCGVTDLRELVLADGELRVGLDRITDPEEPVCAAVISPTAYRASVRPSKPVDAVTVEHHGERTARSTR